MNRIFLNFKAALAAIIFLTFDVAAVPAAQVYSDLNDFLSVIDPGYFLESFDAYPGVNAAPLELSDGAFGVTASSQGGFWNVDDGNGGNALSTYSFNRPITFHITTGNVSAIGGYFYNWSGGSAVDGTFRISLSDGTIHDVVNPAADSFIGFTNISGISWIRISSIGSPGYPTVNDLYVGQMAPSVPSENVVTFTGGSGQWQVPGSWSGGVPTLDSVARIGGTSGGQTAVLQNSQIAFAKGVEFSGPGGSKTLNLSSGSQLTVGELGITTVRENGVTSTIQVAGGSVNAASVDIDTLRVQQNGILEIAEGQSWVVRGETVAGSNGGNSTLALNGGSLQTGTLTVANGGAGTFTMNSGVLAADVIQRGSVGNATFNWYSGTISSSEATVTSIRGANPSSLLQIRMDGEGDHVFDVAAEKSIVVEDTATLVNNGPAPASITKVGDGVLQLAGSNSYTGGTAINGGVVAVEHEGALGSDGAIAFGGGTLRHSAANTVDYSSRFSSADGQAYSVDTNGQDVTYASALTSVGGTLRKSGDGELTLESASSYSGGTAIDGGALRVNNTTGSATGSGAVAVNANGSLTGGGSVSGDVTVHGTIAPGDGIGSMSTGNQIWKGGGSYDFQIGSVSGTPGTAWDFLAIGGTLGIESTSLSPFLINLSSFGELADFSAAGSYSWTILSTTAGIEGFNASRLAVDATGFALEASSAFSLALGNDGKDLVLNYNAPASPLEIVGGMDQRAVRGSEVVVSYALLEKTGATQNYSLLGTNLEELSDVVNGANPNPSITGSSANPITGVVDTSEAQAGDVIEATLQASSDTFGSAPVSKTANIAVVENRELSLDGTGQLGKVDRVVQGAAIADVTLSTGSQTDDEATRITLNGGTYTTAGLSFSTDSQVFDSANESQVITLRAGNGTGLQVINLNLADPSLRTSGNTPLLAKENIAGSSLAGLTDLTITGTATIIANRDLTGSYLNLGRSMAGEGIEQFNGSTALSVSGGNLGDNHATRVFLNEGGSVSDQGVTASVAETVLFDDAGEYAQVEVSYNVGFSRSAGTKSAAVSVASILTSGEESGLEGVVLDNNVAVGVEKTYVENRQLGGASEVVVHALAGTHVDRVTNTLSSFGSDSTNTRITVNGVLLDGSTNFWVDDEVYVNASSAVSTGDPVLQTKSLSEGNGIQGEGLLDESVTSFNWDYGVKFYQGAAAGVSAIIEGNSTGLLGTGTTGLVLGVGDAITVTTAEKSDAGSGSRADTDILTGFMGNDGFSISGLASSLVAGMSGTGTIAFNEVGKMNGTHSARLNLTLSNDLDLSGAVEGDVGSYAFTVSHVVTGATGDGGSAYVASGSRLRNSGLGSSFSNSVLAQKTSASFLDSETLASNVNIQIAFNSIEDAVGAGATDLVSDTISIEGLDGIQFVLQITYDELTLINKFGTEEVAVLTWLDTDDNTWKNAIEGNSTYGDMDFSNPFGRRYRMSYDAYLGLVDGTPILNDYGYDPDANVMWAVIDHNSDFGGSGLEDAPEAIPEPSTWALMLLGAFALAMRWARTRRAAI